MIYPIAEIFCSIQGEGAQSGIPMVFVRLAGCSVGKPYTALQRHDMGLQVFQNECTIYDRRKFPCDTNYRISEKLTHEEIASRIKELHPLCRWVSITGGEPLNHDLAPLVFYLLSRGYSLHLETSGTVRITEEIRALLVSKFEWIVVSPKYPYIDEYSTLADEIRILVDDKFYWDDLPQSVKFCPTKTWISPVGEAESLIKSNGDKCVSLALQYSGLRVSLQIHKVLNVR